METVKGKVIGCQIVEWKALIGVGIGHIGVAGPPIAHIILDTGAAQGGQIRVAIQIDFDFPFAPPRIGITRYVGDHTDAHAQKAAAALHQGQHLEVTLKMGRVLPLPTGVEIEHLRTLVVTQGVIDIVEKRR